MVCPDWVVQDEVVIPLYIAERFRTAAPDRMVYADRLTLAQLSPI